MNALAKLEHITNALSDFIANIGDISTDILVSMGDIIADFQRDQLMQGLTSEGTHISPPYQHESYAREKLKSPFHDQRRNMWTPNLAFSGDFYRGICVVGTEDGIIITSMDRKWDDEMPDGGCPLSEWYGPQVLGLTDENMYGYIVPELRDELIRTLRKNIHI